MSSRALREVGRAVRSIVLLRYVSEPELREGVTAITNRGEAFRGAARTRGDRGSGGPHARRPRQAVPRRCRPASRRPCRTVSARTAPW
ncbi:Tn3 family transposase [Streptomyces niveiscabiei]|uniref:Tn3 family transposase n=1 Tax=Streptomyces niveiscabiei TaxID=164115 RepID=UPI00389B3842